MLPEIPDEFTDAQIERARTLAARALMRALLGVDPGGQAAGEIIAVATDLQLKALELAVANAIAGLALGFSRDFNFPDTAMPNMILALATGNPREVDA